MCSCPWGSLGLRCLTAPSVAAATLRPGAKHAALADGCNATAGSIFGVFLPTVQAVIGPCPGLGALLLAVRVSNSVPRSAPVLLKVMHMSWV